MYSHQGIQLRSSANGFNRRRFEREGGVRMENKIAFPGKMGTSNFSNAVNGGKTVPITNISRDRLLYVSACLIGLHVEVHVKNGSIFSGIFCSMNAQDFGIVLKMAQIIKDGSIKGQKGAPETPKRPQTVIIPPREFVQIIAKDVPLTSEEFSTANTRERKKDLMIDSVISRSQNVEVERELERWTPDVDDPECPELDNIFDGTWNRNWDQFETNETLFGVKSTFNEEIYTTKLVRGPQMRDVEREASRIAREIEGEETQDLHLAEERGLHLYEDFDIDEESRYSAVHRQIDDESFVENENLPSDLCNTETCGGSFSSGLPKSDFDSLKEKYYGEAQALSTYLIVDEETLSQCASDKNSHNSGTSMHSGSSKSDDLMKCTGAGNGGSTSLHYVNKQIPDQNETKSFLFEKLDKVFEEAHMTNGEDEQILLNNNGLSSICVTCDLPFTYPENKETCNQPSEMAPAGKMSSRSELDNQFPVTSSISEHVATDSASNGPSLSPSSSLCSLSSERSTLNPNAKEFKLNPNAKSFTPSSTFRPSPPIPESPFYYTSAISTVPPMQNVSMGVGMGTTFGAHQHVYNSPGHQLQSPQPYIHANGPMYGPQMIVGQPQPFYYMPTYPPDMQFRGRTF